MNICSYSPLKSYDIRGINERFSTLFTSVCYLLSTGGGGGSGTVTSVSVVSANGFAGSVASPTISPDITISTSITGILKGNGTAISAVVSGTDIKTVNGTSILGAGDIVISGDLSSSNFVFNEVPSGTINSVNVTFTLANTPTTGTVQVYRNGLRMKLTTHYSISGSTITFVSAPDTGDDLITDYLK